MNKPYNKSVWQVCQKLLTDWKDITLEDIMKRPDDPRRRLIK